MIHVEPMLDQVYPEDNGPWRTHGRKALGGKSGKKELLWTDYSLPFPIHLHCSRRWGRRVRNERVKLSLGKRMQEGRCHSFCLCSSPSNPILTGSTLNEFSPSGVCFACDDNY